MIGTKWSCGWQLDDSEKHSDSQQLLMERKTCSRLISGRLMEIWREKSGRVCVCAFVSYKIRKSDLISLLLLEQNVILRDTNLFRFLWVRDEACLFCFNKQRHRLQKLRVVLLLLLFFWNNLLRILILSLKFQFRDALRQEGDSSVTLKGALRLWRISASIRTPLWNICSRYLFQFNLSLH